MNQQDERSGFEQNFLSGLLGDEEYDIIHEEVNRDAVNTPKESAAAGNEKPKFSHAKLELMDRREPAETDIRVLFHGEDAQTAREDISEPVIEESDAFEKNFRSGLLGGTENGSTSDAGHTETVDTPRSILTEQEPRSLLEQGFLSGLLDDTENGGARGEDRLETSDAATESSTDNDRLALLGKTLLEAGGMPSEAQLAAMGKTKAEALGDLAVLQMNQFDDVEGELAGKTGEQEQYLEWLKSIGAQETELSSLGAYIEASNNASKEYILLTQYAADVKNGWISPLSGFGNYKVLYNQIETEIVGQTTPNGIIIKGQVPHFMQRVIGTGVDPQKLTEDLKVIRRSGVEMTDIEEALFCPEDIGNIVVRKTGQRSIKYIGRNCVVSVNPDTGMLIQTNPRKR